MTRQRTAVLLDWRGGRRERRLHGHLLRALSVARKPHMLLLHAPGGELGALERLAGIPIVQPNHLLDHDAQTAVDDWAASAVADLLSGPARDALPSLHGVHLGDLNRLNLELEFATVGAINAAMRGVEARLSGSIRWLLLGYDADMLFAATTEARRNGHRAHAWPPGIVAALRDARAARRGNVGSIPVSYEWRAPRADVLTVSWTRPMQEMFAAVEPHLAEYGATPSLRVHLGGGVLEERRSPGVIVLNAPGPETFGNIIPPPIPRSLGDLSGPAFDVDDGRFVRRRLEAIRRNAGRQLAFIEAISRLLDAAQPRVVVVGNDRWWVGQAVVRLAQLRGIRTLCLQDGVGADVIAWRWMSADTLLANGAQLRDVLVKYGVEEHRVIATGQPRYDRLPLFAGLEATRRERAQLRLPSDRQLVLFTTQYDQDPGFVEGIVRACMRTPNVHLLLRPHPSEPVALHAGLVREYPDRISLCRDEPIEALVAACDVLVAKSSTTILEAAMLGKQVIVVHDRGVPLLAHTEAIHPILLKAADELPGVLRRLHETASFIDSAAGRAAFEYYCGPFDGRSSARVAEQFARALEPAASASVARW